MNGGGPAGVHAGGGSERLALLGGAELVDCPVERLSPALLAGGVVVRTAGEDVSHVRLLAGLESELPPIVVHRSTMRVIDGMHRVRAAEMRGDTVILVQFFDGDEEDAFLLSVAVNMRHGLPLTRADRTAAVERILGVHPEWSDRALASFAGVSARRVADIRGGLRAGGTGLEARDDTHDLTVGAGIADMAQTILTGGQPFLSADFSLHILDVSLRLAEGRGITETVPLVHTDDTKLTRGRTTTLGHRS